MLKDRSSDTIAAIATAMSSSGIGIIRVSGDQAVPIVSRIFESKKENFDLNTAPSHRIYYGMIHDGDEMLDEVLVMLMRGPHSYTAEDTVEIDCHGGVLVMKKILETVIKYGARPAEPGEFTKRAFLNGRIDLSQAEAVIDVINAQNDYAVKSSVSQLKGSNKHTDSGIIVEGLGNCLVKFAKCCTPVPGDPVIGFITRGYGVSVHRADCPNAAPENRKPEEAARWVRVSWVDSKLPNYRTALEVASKDRDNLTLDVAMALSAAKVKVTALSARSMPDGHAILRIEVEVRDKEELASVINKLNNIQGVYHVARMTGK